MINNNILFDVNSSRLQDPPMAPRNIEEDEPIPEEENESKQEMEPMIVARSPPISPAKSASKPEPIERKEVDWLGGTLAGYRRYNKIYFTQPSNCIRFDTETEQHIKIPLPES